MSLRKVNGIVLIFTILLASLHIHHVRGGQKEQLAKKLIKLFLATAILSPPGITPST